MQFLTKYFQLTKLLSVISRQMFKPVWYIYCKALYLPFLLIGSNTSFPRNKLGQLNTVKISLSVLKMLK